MNQSYVSFSLLSIKLKKIIGTIVHSKKEIAIKRVTKKVAFTCQNVNFLAKMHTDPDLFVFFAIKVDFQKKTTSILLWDVTYINVFRIDYYDNVIYGTYVLPASIDFPGAAKFDLIKYYFHEYFKNYIR